VGLISNGSRRKSFYEQVNSHISDVNTSIPNRLRYTSNRYTVFLNLKLIFRMEYQNIGHIDNIDSIKTLKIISIPKLYVLV